MGKQSVIDEIAAGIVKQLEEGTAKFIQPWETAPPARPYNPVSGTQYRGVNSMWLGSQGQSDPRWMTYKQAQSVDAQVRRGEKSTGIVFWKFHEQLTVRGPDGKPKKDGNGQTITVKGDKLKKPLMLTARVFNADQIDNLPPLPELSTKPFEQIERAEAVLRDSGASIHHDSNDGPYYGLVSDAIHLPKREEFVSEGLYYATALHELGHWSGHPSRLNRDMGGGFGSETYAQEELRAEIYSYMMSADLQLPHDPSQHVAYIASWIEAIKEDPMTIHRAARDSGKILDYVQGLVVDLEQKVDSESRLYMTEEELLFLTEQTAIDIGEKINRDMTDDEFLLLSAAIGKVDRPLTENELLSLTKEIVEKNTEHAVLPDVTKPIEQQVMSIAQERVFRAAREKGVSIVDARADALKIDTVSKPVKALQRREIPTVKVDPEAEFTQAIKSMGLAVDGMAIMDGQMHRVPVMREGKYKTGSRDGAYVGYLDGRPAGYIKNHYTGEERKWKATGELNFTEKLEIQHQAQKQQAERVAAREKKYQETAIVAREHLAALAPAPADHPYFTAKGIAPSEGLRIDKKANLVVPIHDIGGAIHGYQNIAPNGFKQLAKGMKKAGNMHLIGDPKGADNVLVCEGYATGKSLHEATGLPVAVAMDAGNLSSVARAVQEAYTQASMFIMGDEDRSKDQNIGRIKAEDAARAVGGRAIFPPAEKGSKKSMDFNDMAQSKGKAAVKAVVESGIAKGRAREDRQLEVKDSPKIGIRV